MKPERDLPLSEKSKDNYGINVARFIEHFQVEDKKAIEALQSLPTLCFLLGNVTEQPQGSDSRPDGISRPVFYLTEGSGMFGLKHPEDAQRWKGIFNHTIGSARHVFFLARHLSSLNNEQKQQFFELGFDRKSFPEIKPIVLRDFMLVDHAGRRQVDERNWHNLDDSAHPAGDSETLTRALLSQEHAPQTFIELMRVEDHEFLAALGKEGHFTNLLVALLTYSDWTFGQKPETLAERFAGLRKNQRQSNEKLDMFEKHAISFENALREVIALDLPEQMLKINPYDWETQIREAYFSPSELAIGKALPKALKIS